MRFLATALLVLLLVPACGLSGGPDGEEVGKASFYASSFHGRRTASGEVYDERELTAAHRSLPFGTRVEVVDLETDRRVRVRINDRGPFVKGRVIDLSRRAAEKLQLIDRGVTRVRIRILSRPES